MGNIDKDGRSSIPMRGPVDLNGLREADKA